MTTYSTKFLVSSEEGKKNPFPSDWPINVPLRIMSSVGYIPNINSGGDSLINFVITPMGGSKIIHNGRCLRRLGFVATLRKQSERYLLINITDRDTYIIIEDQNSGVCLTFKENGMKLDMNDFMFPFEVEYNEQNKERIERCPCIIV